MNEWMNERMIVYFSLVKNYYNENNLNEYHILHEYHLIVSFMDIYQWIQSDLSHTYFLLLLSWTYSVLHG